MKQAAERNYHFDFIAFHWYRSLNVDGFRKALEGLADTHQCPVWLTEFNGGYIAELLKNTKNS